ncbi:MAG: FxLYD domain-containing protein [Candidatus Pristimantibacillus sp.]
MEVYCDHCGKEHTADAVYCSQCGKLLEHQPLEAAALAERKAGMSETGAALGTKTKRRTKLGGRAIIIGLIPVILFFVTSATVWSYYLYETNMNDQVVGWHEQAKKDALVGKYEQAAAGLKKAVDARPDYTAAKEDLHIVEEAIVFEKEINTVNEKLKKNAIIEAEPLLEQLKTKLRGREEPLFAVVHDQLTDITIQMTVIQVGDKLEEIQTIDELAAVLNQVKGLTGEDALELRDRIESEITARTFEEAEAFLKKKNFSVALEITKKGMTYATDDEKLTKLYARIEKEKKNFELDEQKRIENAMQKAAEEDLLNQTAAVEVKHIGTELDELGDFHIRGELKNAATRPIYSVTIEYTVRDSEGNVIESGSVEATPNYIEAGESFLFTSVVHEVTDANSTVVIDHATWYLD